MSEASKRPVGNALRRLRRSVGVCCAIVGLALVAQIVIWSLVSFTDLRFKQVDLEDKIAIVESPKSKVAPLKAVGMETVERLEQGPVVVHTKYNLAFRDVTSFALAAGTMALLVLMLLVGVTVVVIAAAGAPGVDEAVSSLIWVVIVAVLTLPVGGVFELPWPGSALRSYPAMVDHITMAQADGSTVSFYGSFLVMPALCLAGIILIGWRFGTACAKGLPTRLPFLDPDLEQEVSGMKVTSLHGGAAAGVLNSLVGAGEKKQVKETVKAQTEKAVPNLRSVSPGDMPRRPI